MQYIVNYFNKPVIKPISNDNVYDVFKNLPNSKKLTKTDFNNGFWCEKDGDLKFFNLKSLKENRYGEDDIKNILKHWGDCYLIKKDNIEFVVDGDLLEDEKLNNELYSSSYLLNNNYLKNKKDLEKKNPKTAMDYYKLSMFIHWLEGNYRKSNQFLTKACQKDKKFCRRNNVVIKGLVKDSKGKGIPGVKVSLISQKVSSLTNAKSEYALNVKMDKLKKERLSFEKPGYSSTFLSVVNISNLQKKIRAKDIEMVKSDKSYTIDLTKKTVDGDGKIDGNKVILKTNISTYKIPLNGFVTDDGKKYKGVVKAYLYEFNDETVPQSLISLDSFSGGDNNFLGTSMKTFGMPYIIFKDLEGNRLDIKKSNPMILTTYIKDLKEQINSPKIADDKKEEILKNSKKGKFYYTLKQWDKDFLSLVSYWVLDQKTGVWENISFDVVDKEGYLRTQFYTTK